MRNGISPQLSLEMVGLPFEGGNSHLFRVGWDLMRGDSLPLLHLLKPILVVPQKLLAWEWNLADIIRFKNYTNSVKG
jgi:hypothetical protein